MPQVVYPEPRSAGPSASHSGSTGRVNGEGPMTACQAISECDFRVSRQAIKDVTRGYMCCLSFAVVAAAASVSIPVDFRVVLTVGSMSDR